MLHIDYSYVWPEYEGESSTAAQLVASAWADGQEVFAG